MPNLWKNSQTAISGELESLKMILDFFVIKKFWFRVVTYLWEREYNATGLEHQQATLRFF